MKATEINQKTYVHFLSPGSFFPEESEIEVTDRDVDTLEIPNGCFAFNFFDIVEVTCQDDMGKVIKTHSNPLNESSRYYVNGTIMTKEEIGTQEGFDSILFRNMESNGWEEIVKCKTGNFQPFNEGDSIVVRK